MISFQNDGLIDLRTITTFGVSSKETENPIGFFGTGLKYAIAICLRLDCKVTLYRGLQKFEFRKERTRIRVNDFDLVFMNDLQLGFTTELGKTWKPWQAFRELYCNCIDEQNPLYASHMIEPHEDKTTFVIEGQAMDEAYANRAEVILEGAPEWREGGVAVHDKSGTSLYYRGIKVAELEKPCHLTYNITGHKIRLTEDRTVLAMWEPLVFIIGAVVKSESSELIRRVVTAPNDHWETEFGFGGAAYAPEKAFLEVMGSINFKEVTNHGAIALYKKYSGKEFLPDETPLNAVETKQLAKAKEFLFKVFDISFDNIPIYITKDLPERTLAMVYEGKIFIGRQCFRQGTKMVAWGLLEEYLHLTTGYRDETRELQSHLFEMLLSLAEEHHGEPV